MNHPHHSPEFLMDENCLLVAAKGMGSVVLNLLNS
jgi:metal-dependent amidase/aminoacylase/carboxypeptidase family protein